MGGPILLPGGMFLPTASLGPTTLLLPGLGLLLVMLRWLLLGALLLLALLILLLLLLRRLLGALLLLALLVLLWLLLRRLLSSLLLLALLPLLPLLRWRRFVFPPIRLVLLLLILVGLSVRWSNRAQKQKYRHRADKNESHKDHQLC